MIQGGLPEFLGGVTILEEKVLKYHRTTLQGVEHMQQILRNIVLVKIALMVEKHFIMLTKFALEMLFI